MWLDNALMMISVFFNLYSVFEKDRELGKTFEHIGMLLFLFGVALHFIFEH